MRICFGAVAYNNPEDIEVWAAHIRGLPDGVNVNVAICDNSTNPNLAEKIKHIADEFSVTYSSDPGNTGYFSGLNQILMHNKGYDLYVLGNSDISYDVNIISILRELEDNSDEDVIAPSILSGDGRDQNPYMLEQESVWERLLLRAKFSSYALYIFYAVLYKLGIIPFFERMNHRKSTAGRDGSKIWAAHGSCFVVKRSYIVKCKELPVRTFLWLEENVFAVYAKIHDVGIIYRPELKVYHKCRGTTGGMSRRMKYAIKKQSFKNYMELLNDYHNYLKNMSGGI